ncbi:MAG: ABC transporter ATP-binding protein [Pseudomonadota bacterium]
MTALAVDGLTVRFGRKLIVDNLDFKTNSGKVVGVLGPNGAGKSTLLKAILKLVPSSGSVKLHNRSIHNYTAPELARAIAYLPQDRDIAWPMTVAAVVALGRLPYQGLMSSLTDEDNAAVEGAMAALGVADLKTRRISELSGGERARVLMARALAQNAPVLIADEPTAGLDPAHQISLLSLFRNLAGQGLLIVLTLHELHFAAQWCDHLILLQQGRLVANGQPSKVLTADRIRSVYNCNVRIIEDADGPIIVPISETNIRSNNSG